LYNFNPGLARLVEKCFSLSGLYVSDEEKSFIMLTPGLSRQRPENKNLKR
jgi:hypothetical protein